MWKIVLSLAALGAMLAFLQTGEWVMLGAIVVMILLHELMHWVVARWFGYDAPVFTIGFGSRPRFVLGTLWGTTFQITPWLLGGYVQIDPGSEQFRKREAWKRLAVILSGAAINALAAVLLMFSLFVTVGERTAVSDSVSLERIVGNNSPAAQAGMRVGDRIVTVDGAVVHSYADLHAHLIAHRDGSPARFVVERGSERLSFSVHPDSRGYIGVKLRWQISSTQHKMGVWPALERAISVVWGMVSQIVLGVLMVLHLVPVTAGAPAGSGAAHGLLSMVQLGGLAFKQGLYSFFNELALFSVNLAFFNLLPIPGLDGGHLAFLGWEKLTGRHVDEKLQTRLGKIALAITVIVMAYAMFNDILHPVA
jgi:regulator of sigma E protease